MRPPTRSRHRTAYVVGAALVAALVVPVPGTQATTSKPTRFDVLLNDGTVVDGSGAKRYVADVGVRDGMIAAVGDLDDATAEQEVDADGLVVAPGFIDIHSHADPDALHRARSSLRQGVTTEMLSPDGSGGVDVDDVLAIERDGVGINVGAYAPFNSLWQQVVGDEDRRATGKEVRRMRALLRTAMRDGAFGVSAGLAYAPAVFAETDQIIDVTKAARRWRTTFTNHIRNENDAVLAATKETITIGEFAGLVPEITHMKVMGARNWGRSKQTLGLIEDAQARGVYAAADVYPYLRSQTGLDATVPAWVKAGGRQAMLKRFADPELRPRIVREIEEMLLTRVEGPEGVLINDLGKTLAQVAEQHGVRTGEAVIRVLKAEGNLSCIWTFGDEKDLRRILRHPTTAVASDGGASTDPSTHPRHYGTQPRVLGHYVREEGVLSLERAVQKLTSLPAAMIGMTRRGYVEPGMVADLTVFDPDTVGDRGTFERPKQYAEGVEQVLIGGRFAVRDGAVTEAPVGQALRRGPSMPSRPVQSDDPARAFAAGDIGGQAQVVFRGRARAGETDGTLVLHDGGRVFHGTEFGRLQTADGWASVTGVGTFAGGDEPRTFAVTLDRRHPRTDGTTVTVQIDGERTRTGTLDGIARF